MVGEVIELGSDVKKFSLGDIVGVGGIVGSCGECSLCKSNLEQYCSQRILPYNDIYKDGTPTQGGFSSNMVVHQRCAHITYITQNTNTKFRHLKHLQNANKYDHRKTLYN